MVLKRCQGRGDTCVALVTGAGNAGRHKCRPYRVPLWMTVLLLAMVTRAGFSQTAPTTQSADFELHEWVVLIASANQPTANSATAFKSTMPTSINSRRPDAPPDARNEPMPIGVIRIFSSDNTAKIDVLLQVKSG